jgi:hypothetical protein
MITWGIAAAFAKKALGFIFDDGRGKLLVVASVATLFFGWFVAQQQEIGALRNAAKGNQVNDKAHSVGSKSARNSNRPGVPGSVLDPSTRYD